MSRKGGTGGSGWVHPKEANSMAASELGFKKAMVGTVQTVSLFLCTIGFRKQSSHLLGPPFLAMVFTIKTSGCWPRILTIEIPLMSGCGQVTNLHRLAAKGKSGVKLGV